jgi:hypothetical protein
MLYPALVTALAVLGAFLAPLVLSYRQAGSRASDTLSPSGHIAPRAIQNSAIIYRLGWVALAPLMAWGIVGELWPVVIYLVSVALGLWLFFALRRPILQALQGAAVHDRSITVHQFIARRHGNDARVAAFAAALSAFTIYGLIACVMIGLATVLRTIFSGSGALAETFVVAIFLLVAGGTLLGSRFGILYATQIQLGLVYFGLFAATVLLLYLQGSAIGAMPFKGIVALLLIALLCGLLHFGRRSRYLDTSVRPSAANATGVREREPTGARLFVRVQKILNSLIGILAMTLIVLAIIVAGFEVFLGGLPAIARETLQALQAGTSATTMTLISLCLLPLLQPMVDVVNWQRVAVFANQRDGGQYTDAEWTAAFKTFGQTYAREVPLMALFVVLFGVLAGLTLAGASEGGATQAFLARLVAQENSVATAIVSLLMLAALALAVATIGSLFCAAIAIVGNDIVPMLRTRLISPADAAGGNPEGGSLTATAAIGVFASVLILATFMLADMRSEHSLGIAGLLGAMLAFSSVQMALVPLALAPLLSRSVRSASLTPAWATTVLAVGAAIGVGITIAGLLFGQAAALPFAVPACFAATALVFLIAALASRRNAAAPAGGGRAN